MSGARIKGGAPPSFDPPDLTTLRVIVAVAESGSMSAGSDRAGLALGAVSGRITALERATGTALFERSNRGVRTTATGQFLVQRARELLAEADRLTLDLGGRKLELRAWPRAHTDNDLSVFDAVSGTLWTGDLLFVERTPSIDGDVAGWLSAIEELDRLPAVRTVPGHGPVIRDKRRALARQRDYLAVLLRDVRASIRGGGDMAAAMETAAASERWRWQLFDAVNPRNVSAIYPALEWE